MKSNPRIIPLYSLPNLVENNEYNSYQLASVPEGIPLCFRVMHLFAYGVFYWPLQTATRGRFSQIALEHVLVDGAGHDKAELVLLDVLPNRFVYLPQVERDVVGLCRGGQVKASHTYSCEVLLLIPQCQRNEDTCSITALETGQHREKQNGPAPK